MAQQPKSLPFGRGLKTDELLARRPHVVSCAPAAPPCFGDTDEWISYLCAVEVEERKRLLTDPCFRLVGGRWTFNLRFNYCDDCRVEFRERMRSQGTCDPTFLLRKIPAGEPIRLVRKGGRPISPGPIHRTIPVPIQLVPAQTDVPG